jgi:steroid 5-alpha reductase family enzyme
MGYYFVLAIILFVYMSMWFVFSVIKQRNDVADVAWGLGFVLMTWISFFVSDVFSLRSVLVGVMVTIWGLRLAIHIYTRNKNKSEDYRYLAWRQEWGNWFYFRSFLQVYILQGVLLFLIVMPVLFINNSAVTSLNIFDLLGFIIWTIGLFFEVVGDLQLSRFIKDSNNKGKLMRSGLWAYTRHPNYFGEVTVWWGVWLMAATLPSGLFSIIGPLTITVLILKVSGIPMLEKKMEENPEFAEYKRMTSVFIPLPTRK